MSETRVYEMTQTEFVVKHPGLYIIRLVLSIVEIHHFTVWSYLCCYSIVCCATDGGSFCH